MRDTKNAWNKLKNVDIPLKNTWLFLVILDIAMFVIGMLVINYEDLINIDLHWIDIFQEKGFFNMYHGAFENGDQPSMFVDYPPLYPLWLLTTGFVANAIRNASVLDIFLQNILLQGYFKLFPLAFTVASQMFFYKKVGKDAAVKWTLLSSMLINSFAWGQRDIALSFFVILMIYGMHKKKIVLPTVAVLLACLLKPQGIFLIFPLLMYFFYERNIPAWKKIASFVGAICIGYGAFTPFSVAEKDPLLPFKYYLWVSSKRVRFTEAPNAWAILWFREVPKKLAFLSPLLVVAVMILATIVLLKTKDLYKSILFYVLTIYMFTLSQNIRMETSVVACAFAMAHILGRCEFEEYYKKANTALLIAETGWLIYINCGYYFSLSGIESKIYFFVMIVMISVVTFKNLYITVNFVKSQLLNRSPRLKTGDSRYLPK